MWRSNTLWPQDNYTALHLAVESGKSSVVEALLGHGAQVTMKMIKGEVEQFFYWLKVFIGPKLRQVSKGNFHRKAPKWVKNQVKGSKIDQIRTKWHPTCWGNPPILSSELLRESINCVIRPTEGIHLLTISASDLLREFTDSVIGATEGIHQFCHPTYWGNPHEYISYRWPSFKYNCTFRTSSLQPPSSWNPCSYHLPLSNFGH